RLPPTDDPSVATARRLVVPTTAVYGRAKPRLRRYRRHPRTRPRPSSRFGLYRQKQHAHSSPTRLLFFLGRTVNHPRYSSPSHGRGPVAFLRPLPPLLRCLPHGRLPPTVRFRRPPLHLLPHHRAKRVVAVGATAVDGQLGLRLRHLPTGVPVQSLFPAPQRAQL